MILDYIFFVAQKLQLKLPFISSKHTRERFQILRVEMYERLIDIYTQVDIDFALLRSFMIKQELP